VTLFRCKGIFFFFKRNRKKALNPNLQINGSSISLLVSRAKGLLAQAIEDEFVTVRRSDAIAYSMLSQYLRQRQFLLIPCGQSEELPRTVIDESILNALQKQLFSSARGPTKFTCTPTITLHRRLTRSIRFVMKHLRLVSHNLTVFPKAQWFPLSIKLSCKPRLIRLPSCQFIQLWCIAVLSQARLRIDLAST
jgi:hypothetical protein